MHKITNYLNNYNTLIHIFSKILITHEYYEKKGGDIK
jgi:hypothetical protein